MAQEDSDIIKTYDQLAKNMPAEFTTVIRNSKSIIRWRRSYRGLEKWFADDQQ